MVKHDPHKVPRCGPSGSEPGTRAPLLPVLAENFGVHEATLAKRMRHAKVDAGPKPGISTDAAAEIRELRRRNKILERVLEVMRRAAAYFGQAQIRSERNTRSPAVRSLVGPPRQRRRVERGPSDQCAGRCPPG